MDSEHNISLTVPEGAALTRIDKFLSAALKPDFSRSFIQKLIAGGHALVNSSVAKANYKIKGGDLIQITIPAPEVPELIPENIPLNILYQDNDIAVINKTAGMVVHPGPGNWRGTLAGALLYHLDDLSSIGGTERPGIVHRLDRDTSGLMVVAKNDRAHRFLSNEFSERRVKKEYAAVVVGKPPSESGTIDSPIGRSRRDNHRMAVDPRGRSAQTEYRLQEILRGRLGIFSLLRVRIHTGRTHQIRVHFSSIGNPVVGDPFYSRSWKKYKVPYLLLASVRLEFTHPSSGESVAFSIELPLHIREFIDKQEKILKNV